MPMPLSAMVSVPVAASGVMRIARRLSSPRSAGLRDRLVAQPVAGVGRVRDQLAQEDVRLGVDRVHHEPQKLGHLGLERVGLGSLGGRRIGGHGLTRCRKKIARHICADGRVVQLFQARRRA
jgi:hypothetical protein